MEEWKNIPFAPGYAVSNTGKVKSYKRKIPIERKLSSYSNGYLFVALRVDNKSVNYLVHRLVMMVFKPIDNMEDMEVNHIDCDRTNNNLDNLEWTTPKENRDYRDHLKHTPKAQTILVHFLDGKEDMIFNTKTATAEYFGVSRKAIDRYLETDQVRSDRKVQAIFRLIGNTYELNK